MKRAGITRQLMFLVVAFSLATPTAIGGLAYVFYQSRATSRARSASNDRRTDALFALVESVEQVQATVQRLLREKDPDSMEKFMDQGKAASTIVRAKIQEAGAT